MFLLYFIQMFKFFKESWGICPWPEWNVQGTIYNTVQERIQEFQNGGGGRSRRGRFLRSKVCFDAPSHISYVFVRRSNEWYTYCKHCMLTKIKIFAFLRLYNENLQKQVPFFFKRGGGGARRGSAFAVYTYNKRPISHIAHLRKLNTYDYIITLIKRRKKS